MAPTHRGAALVSVTDHHHRLLLSRDHAKETADCVITLSAEHGFTDFLATAACTLGRTLAQQGRREEGIAQMQEGLAMFRVTGMELGRPSFLCRLAEALMEADRLGEGLNALTEARKAADQREERQCEAEIHRLKGELLLWQSDIHASEARSCFERTIEIAREQSAKSYEFRATTSLARLLNKQGRRAEARTMLAEIYNWFTEGFDTADLKDAKSVLDELSE
jgi:predicted ATPase